MSELFEGEFPVRPVAESHSHHPVMLVIGAIGLTGAAIWSVIDGWSLLRVNRAAVYEIGFEPIERQPLDQETSDNLTGTPRKDANYEKALDGS